MGHEDVDGLALDGLLELLDDLEQKRTPVGWTPEDAVMRAAVERRILELVAREPDDVERRGYVRVPCDLNVKLRTADGSHRGRASNVGVGGVFVETEQDAAMGTPVELEVRGSGVDEHGLRVHGTVAWREQGRPGVGVSFASAGGDANERRLRRFVLELLRNRLSP